MSQGIRQYNDLDLFSTNGTTSVSGDNLYLSTEGSLSLKRSEEHTSELQSHSDLVCRLLLEKKKASSKTSVKLSYADC